MRRPVPGYDVQAVLAVLGQVEGPRARHARRHVVTIDYGALDAVGTGEGERLEQLSCCAAAMTELIDWFELVFLIRGLMNDALLWLRVEARLPPAVDCRLLSTPPDLRVLSTAFDLLVLSSDTRRSALSTRLPGGALIRGRLSGALNEITI